MVKDDTPDRVPWVKLFLAYIVLLIWGAGGGAVLVWFLGIIAKAACSGC